MSEYAIRRPERGFSLPEIMVGMVIGMLGIIIIMQMSSLFESQKRTTSGGDDAQNSGAIALFGISRDIKEAGYGFSSPFVIGLNMVTPNVTLTPLSPVSILKTTSCTLCTITHDANTDGLLVAYGNSNTAAEGRLIKDSIPANSYSIAGGAQPAIPGIGTGGTTFRVGDYVIPDNGVSGVGATAPHYLYQVGGTSPTAVPINDLAYGVPHPVLTDNPVGNHPTLFNMGPAPSILVYVVHNGALWVCNFMDGGGCPATPATGTNWMQLAGDVVSMRAECTAPAYGVRVVLVTRNAAPDVNYTAAVPTWGGATAINLAATQVAGGFAWQNYRYKTFETIVPIRNITWGGKGVSGCQ